MAAGADKPGGELDTGSSFDNLQLVDPGLAEKLAILRVGSDRTVNNCLSVFAGLKNKTGERLDLEVQTLYKDQAGNALNTSSWIPVSLSPRDDTEYRSASIAEEAVDFLIRIRLARDNAQADH